MLIIGGLFFMFGFITWLNGSLIPFLQIACELNHVEAYFVTMAFYIAYTLAALPAAHVLRRTGYKNGMVLGLLVMVVGALVFIPAAMLRTYSIFLLALFILGTGLTLLQAAANPYIVLIGPRETAAVRISIMGILNKSAGVIAPLVFTAFVLTDMSSFSEENLALLDPQQHREALKQLSSRLVEPYCLMAAMLLILAALIKRSPLPEPASEDDDEKQSEDHSILHFPQLILGAIALFFYVGAEVIAGDTIGLFGRGAGVENFGQLTSYTMSFMVAGYLLGMLLIPRWLSQEKALAASAIFGLLFTLLLMNSSTGSSGLWNSLLAWTGAPSIPDAVLYVALFGLANALVWPAIWPLALAGLSQRNTATGSALLIMGISGGAILPLIYGLLAESISSPQNAYRIMIPCYLFILFYALKGHKIKRWSDSSRAAEA